MQSLVLLLYNGVLNVVHVCEVCIMHATDEGEDMQDDGKCTDHVPVHIS